MTRPVVCHTMTIRMAHSARPGSASQGRCQLSIPIQPRNWLIGPLKSKMNFQMYDTASGLSTTGMNSSTRSRYRVFSVRLSARASSSPSTLVASRKPNARNSVFFSEPRSVGSSKIRRKFSRPTNSKSPMPVQLVKA